MRSIIFGKRTLKEILRDPLSYIFCLGFPLVMLIIMTVVNESIPEQAHMDIFEIQNLAPGIAVFGLTFIMIFACLQISKDRATTFLNRLYASPMKPKDFIGGYTIPLILLSVIQILITLGISVLIGFIGGYTFHPGNILVCILVLIPSAFLFISFGLLFGTLLSDKAAPGICSIIITISSILGGIWMDVDSIGGIIQKVCQILPFYHGVAVARMALNGQYSGFGRSLSIIVIYAVVIFGFAVLAFRKKMQSDLK